MINLNYNNNEEQSILKIWLTSCIILNRITSSLTKTIVIADQLILIVFLRVHHPLCHQYHYHLQM